MLTAIFSAVVLTIVLGISVMHMPLWFKRLLAKCPIWLQCIVLHFGYAAWLGGVTGHLIGAPLAILWLLVWVFYLKPEIETQMQLDKPTSFMEFVEAIRMKVRKFMGQVNEVAGPVTVAA